MKIIKNNEQGYTLTELSIVLIILSTILLIAMPSFSSLTETKSIDYFIEQLEEDIYYTQTTALSRGKTVTIQFKPDDYYYSIQGSVGEVFLERSYSNDIYIDRGSLDLRIYFNASGNIQKAGTLRINTKKGNYALIFQLGKGRFYAEKR